jgi:hypothetical protein
MNELVRNQWWFFAGPFTKTAGSLRLWKNQNRSQNSKYFIRRIRGSLKIPKNQNQGYKQHLIPANYLVPIYPPPSVNISRLPGNRGLPFIELTVCRSWPATTFAVPSDALSLRVLPLWFLSLTIHLSPSSLNVCLCVPSLFCFPSFLICC